MLNRRTFLAAGGVAVWAALAGEKSAPAQESAAPPQAGFRTITYNTRKAQGWGLRKEQQERLVGLRPQLPQRMALELALYAPDVITLVEAPDEKTVAGMAQMLGMDYRHGNDASPGAVLSRNKILEWNARPEGKHAPYTKAQFPTHCARTRLDTPLGAVILYSVHYTARNQKRRTVELETTLDIIADDVASGASIILQGDLNHSQQWPEYQRWVDIGLQDAFQLKGAGVAETLGTAKPSMRIDYIWLHGPIVDRLAACRGLFEGAFRTNPEDPGSVALSDHIPVMATFA